MKLTAKLVRSALIYEPSLGAFWRRRRGRLSGLSDREPAGHLNKRDGYFWIVLAGRKHPAHRLAWAYMTGELPPDDKQIDHINRIRSDNRFANLRLASASENAANKTPRYQAGPRGNTKGITFNRRAHKWQAQITKDGKCHYLGVFPTIREAEAAYKDAAARLFGSFGPPPKQKALL